MAKKIIFIIIVVAAVAVVASFVWGPSGEFSGDPIARNAYPDLIQVDAPKAYAVIASPLTVTGKARGSWYFEASFPVRLLDANGTELAVTPAQAKGEWMTEDFVPFEATLTFNTPTTKTGTLILHNDNPSGDPAYDKEIRIPVTFSTVGAVESSGMNGYVHMGPTCPVEKDPPDPACADKPYANATVTLTGKTGTSFRGVTDAHGQFHIVTPPDTYTVKISPQNGGLPRCTERSAAVVTGLFTIIDISCDTGIR